MAHPLDDCRAKVVRARDLLAALDRSAREFLARDPYDLVQRDDPATGEHVVSVRIRENPPSAQLATLIGDAANNLRSALDYLSQQLVRANGQAPTRRTQFPIFHDAGRYAAEAPGMVRGMSPAGVRWIEGQQPFAGGGPDRHILWVLHDLNNADKHRELSVVGSAVHAQALTGTADIQIRITPAGGPVGLGARMPVLILHDGMELVRLGFVDVPARGGSARVEGAYTFGLSFERPEIVRGQPVVPLMRRLAEGVAAIVEGPEVRTLIP